MPDRETLLVALDAAHMGAWELDLATGETTHRNLQHDRIFGHAERRPEWSLATTRDHVIAEDRARFDAAVDRAKSTGHLDVEVRIARPDGLIRWIHMTGDVRGAHGGAQHMAGVVVDRTVDREYEEELERRVAERTQQVRDLVARLSRAEQAERRRVSQVLHDDLQQTLYAIQMRLGVLRDDLDQTGRARDASALGDAIARLGSAIEMTRRLTVDMSPPVLAKEGLGELVGWLRPQMRDLYGLDVDLTVSGDPAIEDPDLRVLLFQVVRELLFNVTKHAGVSRAAVTMRADGGWVEVEVTDEGDGFDVAALEAIDPDHGFGLRSARERIDLLGGEIVVRSAPGQGTRVTLRAPAVR